MQSPMHPFAVGEPGNVPLPSAPLVRAIAQVRFPALSLFHVRPDEVANHVIAALAADYPSKDEGKEVQLDITPEGVSRREGPRMWRLTSADGQWQVSFSLDFISIDTTNYVRRSDFAGRLNQAWEALNSAVPVPSVSRIGVRYINQVGDQDLLPQLPGLLNPAVRGVSAAQGPGATLVSALSEARYDLGDGAGFNARWGMLPANAAVDAAVPALPHVSWLLDMDSFRAWESPAQDVDIEEEVRALALRGYQFFRWAATEEFLTVFGGETQ